MKMKDYSKFEPRNKIANNYIFAHQKHLDYSRIVYFPFETKKISNTRNNYVIILKE